MDLVIGCVEQIAWMTDHSSQDAGEGLIGYSDDDVRERWDEGNDPDQCNQGVRPRHCAHLGMMKRSTHGHVTFYSHAG